ncbi:lipid A deacylase LpxR family protein [Arcobacter sp. s6]|uniref:lipid A deacylase LpxR family protein n=1 Tax=Arcobacter sp. s6 TaxID=3230363 RepID=UPI0034A032E3
MKLYLKIIAISFISLNLNAEVISGFIENDVINGEDKHYTNGIGFSYLSNKDTNDLNKYDNSFFDFLSKIPTFNNDTKYQSLGMTLSHLTFTPDKIEQKNKIIKDVPYAGVMTVDFSLYQWEEDFFHQYVITLGMAGPSASAHRFQKSFHHLTANTESKGWDNQLEDDFLYNFSYAYGYKVFKHDFSYGKMDIINNIRIDFGNYNRNLMAGSTIRYGSNYPSNFNTIGRFLGVNENKLLNLDSKSNKDFGWAISYGLGYSYNDYFYVTNYDKSYELDKLKDTLVQVISYDTYFDNIVLSFTYKTSKFLSVNNKSENENWGGFNIAYLF